MPTIRNFKNGCSIHYSPDEEEEWRQTRIKVAKYLGHTDGRMASYEEVVEISRQMSKKQRRERILEQHRRDCLRDIERWEAMQKKKERRRKLLTIVSLGLYRG